MNRDKYSRIFWLDVARAVAILLVVFTHVKEQIGINNIFLKSLTYSIDRMGVPIFLMLSGGLILTKLEIENEYKNYYKKYYKKIISFLLLLIFYSISITTIHLFLKNGDFVNSFFIALKNHNGIYPFHLGSGYQLWYLYNIMSFYIIAPYLSKLLKNLTDKEIILLIIFSTFSFHLRYSLELIFKIQLNIMNIGSYLITDYLVYILLGYLIINRNYNINKKIGYFLLFFPIIILLIIETIRNKFYNPFHWYSTSIVILTSSVGFISLIKNYFVTKNHINNIYIYI